MSPDSLHYRLVYDVARAGYADWYFPGIGVALLVAALASARFRRKHALERSPRADRLLYGFLACWIIGAFAATYGSYRSMRKALQSGRFTVVEGRVRGYRWRDPDQLWEVESGGRVYRYAYKCAALSPGSGRLPLPNVPIHEGVQLRIADVGGSIARLEVAP